jgi:hypothetical protein
MLRFTIRDLLWLMVVVGLASGWWVDHRRISDDPQWRTIAGALEQLLLDQGYGIGWGGGDVFISKDGKTVGKARTDHWQPNVR